MLINAYYNNPIGEQLTMGIEVIGETHFRTNYARGIRNYCQITNLLINIKEQFAA